VDKEAQKRVRVAGTAAIRSAKETLRSRRVEVGGQVFRQGPDAQASASVSMVMAHGTTSKLRVSGSPSAVIHMVAISLESGPSVKSAAVSMTGFTPIDDDSSRKPSV